MKSSKILEKVLAVVLLLLLFLFCLKSCSMKNHTQDEVTNNTPVQELEEDNTSVQDEIEPEVVVEKVDEVTVTEEVKEETEVTPPSYWVYFLNKDGSVISSISYAYGTMPAIPTNPTYSDGVYYYSFTGWDKVISPVYGTQTYIAEYIQGDLIYTPNNEYQQENNANPSPSPNQNQNVSGSATFVKELNCGLAIGAGHFYHDGTCYGACAPVTLQWDEIVLAENAEKYGYFNSYISANAVGGNAFKDCPGLKSITIPNSITTIENSAFWDCTALNTVTIQNNLTTIDDYAFTGCTNLTSITIPNTVTTIGGEAFKNCASIATISIPTSVSSMGNAVFMGCSSLTSIVIPDGITTIGTQMFDGCSNLTSIEFPGSVSSIGDDAFSSCNSLNTIVFNGTKEQWAGISKSDCGITEPLAIFGETATISVVCTNGSIGYKLGSGCVVKGTLITLADGSQKTVENVALEDELMVFDFYTGKVSSNKIMYINEHVNKPSTKFHIVLDNGAYLDMVDWQSFFDMNERYYFDISIDTYKECIGRSIMYIDNSAVNTAKIINIKVENVVVDSYEIFTEYNKNFVANNVLTVEPETWLPGVYTIDENLKINQEVLDRDIETYGIFTYEEFKDLMSLDSFNKANIAHKKISVGKGLTDEEWLFNLYNIYKLD